jgi:hypothetical protein
MRLQLIPQPCQHGTIQILQALHRRRRLRQRGPFGFGRLGNGYGGRIFQVRLVAERGEKPLGQPAPENERRRQWFVQEPGRQHLQTARGRRGEALAQTRAVAWLSFGSACSSGSTNKCPPGDNARVCDMASEAYSPTLPARHQFHRGGINSRRDFDQDDLKYVAGCSFGRSCRCSHSDLWAASKKCNASLAGQTRLAKSTETRCHSIGME